MSDETITMNKNELDKIISKTTEMATSLCINRLKEEGKLSNNDDHEPNDVIIIVKGSLNKVTKRFTALKENLLEEGKTAIAKQRDMTSREKAMAKRQKELDAILKAEFPD